MDKSLRRFSYDRFYKRPARGRPTRCILFWIERPGLYLPWPTFGAAIGGLAFYAIWILHQSSIPGNRLLKGGRPAVFD
jgi:hypothetical protein